MWKFQAINDWDTISLHDCQVTCINEQDNNISLHFTDGYWIIESNSQNPYKKTLSTNDSLLTFMNACCEKVKVDNKQMTWEEFYSKINSSKWKFECITENYTNRKSTYEGWVWFNKKPYHLDCFLEFSYHDVIYNWNEICEDRPW